MTISAVAFDVFGTLCHGESSSGLLPWLDDLPHLERQHIVDEWMCGRLAYQDLIQYGEAEAAPSAHTLQSQAEAVAATTQVYDGALRVLKTLRERQIPTACISNLAEPFGNRVRMLLSPWIDYFVFSYEVSARKPAVEVFQFAIESLRLPPEEILMVGDSARSDATGALQVGMPFFLVSHVGREDANAIEDLIERIGR